MTIYSKNNDNIRHKTSNKKVGIDDLKDFE